MARREKLVAVDVKYDAAFPARENPWRPRRAARTSRCESKRAASLLFTVLPKSEVLGAYRRGCHNFVTCASMST